jgi:predicted amidohydrolase
MVKVTIVEPNITPEENEENLSKVISILEKIVQEINKA